jgi:superfamily II DNA or RNA helicase
MKFQGWQAVAARLLRYVAEKEKEQATRPNAGQRAMLSTLAERLPKQLGVLIADEVGMGKTLIAAEVIRAVEQCGGRVAVLMPSGLGAQWQDELRNAKLNTAGILRSFEGLISNPPPLETPGVILLSHTFFNWRMGGSTKSKRFDLLPVMYGKWRSKQCGRLPRGYHQAKHESDFETVAEACIDLCEKDKGHPFYKKLNELAYDVGWDTKAIYDQESYTKGTPYRYWLECCAGMALGVFDLVVVDEAHKNRGADSGLSRSLDRLVGSSQCKVLAMTATPVELDSSQWDCLLTRLGADEKTVQQIVKCSAAYVEAVQKLQQGWRDEQILQRFEKEAQSFHQALSPWVLRRSKAEDEAVQLYKRLAGTAQTYAYQTTHEVAVSDLAPRWQQVVCAAEALSLTAQALSDEKSKRVRLTVANGHGLTAIQDSLFATDTDLPEAEAAQSDPAPAKTTAAAGREARAKWWLRVMQKNLSSSHALYQHPAIIKAVQCVEKITKDGEKVLVFGTFTAPLRAFTELLNARFLVQAIKNGGSVPLEKIPGELKDAIQIELAGDNSQLEELEKWLRVTYQAAEKQRNLFRSTLIETIRSGISTMPRTILSIRAGALLETLPDELVPLLARAYEEMLPEQEMMAGKPETIAQTFVELIGHICVEDEGDKNQDGQLDIEEAAVLWPAIKDRLRDEYSSPRGHFARMISGETKHASRRTAQMAFNRPDSRLRVLVAQSQVGREGLNLHKACRHVLLLHPEWNPGVVEQQVGRVDRVGSYWSRLLHQYKPQNGALLPHIELHCLIFKGTYDEYHWKVLQSRRLALRAQLHGEILPLAQAYSESDRRILERVMQATPTFSPMERPQDGIPFEMALHANEVS